MIKSREEVLADLEEIRAYFDKRMDTKDGPNGPEANEEMRLALLAESTLEYVDYHDAS